MPELVLGPVLRYVDATSATVWVQTDAACEVEVLGHRARTFEVDAHHFALVAVTGLEPGARTPYGVALDERPAWHPERDGFPPSVVRTVPAGADVRLAFGSCREVAPHEPPFALHESADPRGHGVDALRTFALELMAAPDAAWPDALLMLGDQLYADEPPRRLTSALRRRTPRGDGEVRARTFGDYALLYRESWNEPPVRWLLSTLPSMMIFDDHEIVDEWKISRAWLDERRGDREHERRVTSGLMAYWVFQHLGNLSPDELAADEVYRRVRSADAGGPALAAFARDADRQVGHSRWSFGRDLGRVRLVVLDSRASRRLEPGDRRIIDDAEWRWAAERATAVTDRDRHLVLASSLPFLLPPGLHDIEAAVERIGDGAWGRRAALVAEWIRCAFNLGHWATFQASFRQLAALLEGIAARGGPASVVLLSGDVHHGYLARLEPRGRGAVPVWQVVSSPFRKRLGTYERWAMRFGASRAAEPLGSVLARAAGVATRPTRWRLCVEPTYENQLATLEFRDRRARARLFTTRGADWRHPQLRHHWERWLA